MRRARLILALGALLVPAGLVAGCGGVPGNAVATVDDTVIEKAEFDHWLSVAVKANGQANAAVPQPPNYDQCVATKKKAAQPAKGQPKPTDASLRTQCKQEYEALRDQVLQLLISEQWIEGEAQDLKVSLPDAEVRKSFDQQRKQAFPKQADYDAFLKQSGQTTDDVLKRIRLEQLSNKIRDQVIKGKDKVSDAQVRDYYNKNKAQFAQPETRDLRVVLTSSKARAETAKDALEGGQSFAAVAKRYSTDDVSKDQGGRLPGVPKGQQERAFDKAIFAADRGELTGPVKTQFGYYVFEVSKITAAKQQSLQQSTATIKQLLASQNQQKALTDFVDRFQKKWRDRTDCREGFVTENCKDGPEPKPAAAQQQQQQPAQPAPVEPGT